MVSNLYRREKMKTCLSCKIEKADEAFKNSLPICWDCIRPKQGKRNDLKKGKPKLRPDGEFTCSGCGKVKPANRLSQEAKMRLGFHLCYQCARRAGIKHARCTTKMRCLSCGVVRRIKDFPANWNTYGRHCKLCIKSGAVTERMKGKI